MKKTNNQVGIPVLQTDDVNSKRFFSNKTLCAQFLRNYSGLEVLKNVQPEDIEEVTLRYHLFDSRELNSDNVVRIRLKSEPEQYFIRKNVRKDDTLDGFHHDVNGTVAEKKENILADDDNRKAVAAEKILVPVYIIPLIDHKNKVDYNVAVQLLSYIVCIWKDWEKEMAELGIKCTRSDFRYPFIFPIVYYEGSGRWTAPKNLSSRVSNSTEFLEYIPDFRYCVVGIHDYSDEELLARKDEMSFLMLLNKIHRAEDVHRVAQLAADSADDILKDSPDEVVDIVAGTAKSIFRKLNVPEDEADGYIQRLRKDRKVGVLFENFEKVDIQKERQLTRKAVDALKVEKESHDKTLKELKEKDGKLKEQDEKLKEQDEKLKEQDEKLKEQDEKLKEQDEKLKEQGGKLKEQDEKLKKQNAALKLAVQRLAADGNGVEQIVEILNLSPEKVRELLAE